MVPEGWTTSKVKDLPGANDRPVTKLGPFGSALKKSDYVAEGYKVYGQQQVLAGDETFGDYWVNEEKFNQLKACSVQSGDILLSTMGTFGGVLRLTDDCADGIINPRLLRLSINKSVAAPEFLEAFLKSSLAARQFLSFAQGGTMPAINGASIGGLKIPLPPLPEQRKIADILSTWDRAIGKTESLLANARTQKRALMQSLLTGKRRFPAFEGQPWKVTKIGNIAVESSQRNKGGEQLTVISCTKTIGFVNSLDYFKKQVFSDDLSGYKVIRRNQIGYPSNHIEEGSIGIQHLHDEALVSPIYTVFETSDLMDPTFLFRVLKTDRYRQEFAAATNASVDRRGSLRWKAFSLIKVPCPSIEEQNLINEVMDAADGEIEELTSQVTKLRTEKKALMQQLLTGKRRVAV